MSKTIRGQKYYRPREIAALGLIQSSAGTNNIHGNYKFVLNLIRTGELPAKDYSNTDRPYYLVSEKAVEQYHKSFITP